jgi:hypothetical protein
VYSFNLKIDRCIHFRDGYLVWEEERMSIGKRRRGTGDNINKYM